MSRTTKDYILIGLKGMAMGAADIVPGVSGGTIALIAGIYEEFLNSLKSFSSALLVLKNDGIKATWKHVNGNFLVALFGGIAVSLLSLVKFIKYALVEHPILLWSFFFGLIIASVYFVGKQVSKWDIKSLLALLLGTVGVFLLTSLGPAETPTDLWFVFIAGMLAICAMILPGISGAFILVLLGKYAYVIEALSDFKFSVIITFGLGCITGLLSFSHFLSYMLKKHFNITIALLTGFMIGSLNKIWPWKNTLETMIDRHSEVVPKLQENVLPANLEIGEPQVLFAVLLAVAGFALIFGLELFAQKKESAS